MTHVISRAAVEEFYAAYAVRDMAKIAAFLHDDVYWTVSGPIDLLSFCGERHSKAEVIRMLENVIPTLFRRRSFEPDRMVVDGNDAAVLAVLSATKFDGRTVRYRVAHFLRFRDGKIAQFSSVIDSFNAVEQMLGHAIDLTAGAGGSRAREDDVIAI